MELVTEALGASHRGPHRPGPSARAVLVVGGGGVLGSAVLEQLLGLGRFWPVRVLVTQAFKGSVRGLDAVLAPNLVHLGGLEHRMDSVHHADPVPPGVPAPDAGVAALPVRAGSDVAVVVFDRERHANGRDEAFVRVEPDALPRLAQALRRLGTRHLVIVLPHSPAGLPQALKRGLANLDEQGVTSLGFEHVVFVRTAQQPGELSGRSFPQRVADGLLMQLRLMIPASHQPVRVRQVARFVAELAVQLPASPPGSRVAPPELVWQAAQQRDIEALVAVWLSGAELPPIRTPRMRL